LFVILFRWERLAFWVCVCVVLAFALASWSFLCLVRAVVPPVVWLFPLPDWDWDDEEVATLLELLVASLVAFACDVAVPS